MDVYKVQRLVVVMIFACFMLANLPLITATAENSSELSVENVCDEVVEQSVDLIDTSEDEKRYTEQNVEDKPEEEQREERQEKVKKSPGEPEPERAPKEKSDNRPSKKGLAVVQSIQPPTPLNIPNPPEPTWTEVSGILPTQTWTVAGNPYYVIGNISIPFGNTLTIDPGVQVLFNGTFEILVSGTLTAVATAGSHITIDTNFAGFWLDIEFDATGAGTFTYVDFDGANNTIHFLNATNTVEISYCTFNNNIANFGIWVEGESSCGLNIHDNTFDTTNYSVYEDVCFLTSGTVTVGGRTFSDNTINGAWGYYSNRLEFDNPGGGTVITVGQTTIDQNTFTNAQQSIYIGNYHVHDKQYGTVNWGANIITGNSITQSANAGIYWYGQIDNVTDTTVNLGLMSVINNNITNTGGRAINVDFWDLTNLSGTTSVYLGPTNINDNDLYTGGGGSDGIYVLFDAMGEPIFDSAYIHMADFTIANNEVFSCDGDGIFFEAYVGMNMSGYSNLRFGDFIIDNNDIYQSSGRGINNSWNYLGYNMYQDSRVVVGDFVVSNNVVTADGDALYVYLDEFGYQMFQDTQISVGLLNIHHNEFNSTNNDGGNISVYSMGNWMHGDARADFAGISCVDNTFISWGGTYALLVDNMQEIGYENYGYSLVTYGDIQFNHNTIDGAYHGLYMDDYHNNGRYLRGYSKLYLGNFEVNSNTITAMRDDSGAVQDGRALYVDNDNIGDHCHAESYVEVGHIQVNDNNITLLFGDSSWGIQVDIDYYGHYNYGNSDLVMTGNVEVCRNYVDCNASTKFWAVGGKGMDVWVNRMGSEAEGNNRLEFKNFLVNNNTVISNGTGLEVDYRYFAYQIESNTEFVAGDLECNGNWVWTNGSTGIDCDRYELGYYVEFNASARFGNFELNDNTINTTGGPGGRGMTCKAEWIGEDVDGNGTFIVGDVECNRNTIIASGDGIYGDYSYFGYDGEFSSTYIYGNFTTNDNFIVAGDDGMYWQDWMDGIGQNLDHSVYVETGYWEIMRNNITAVNYGIYADLDDVGDSLEYGPCEVHIGDVRINDNVINTSNNDGIHLDIYEVGDYCEDGAVAYVGNISVNGNTIVAGDDGIWIEIDDYAESLAYGGQAYLGDINCNYNTIDTDYYDGDQGIWLAYDDICSGFRHDSRATTGDFNVVGNNIRAEEEGLNVYEIRWVAEDLEDTNYGQIGDFNFNQNTIYSVNSSAIKFEYISSFGDDVEDASMLVVGDFNVNDNNLTAPNGSGIYFNDMYDIGTEVEDVAKCHMGDFNFLRNNINAWEYGIYLEPRQVAEDCEDGAYTEVGDWRFNYNTIHTVNSTALHFNPRDFGH
ncbi:MAG: hypothetical protein KAX31_04410, partial [Thermoplasmata archaeon]|nr:hypothetical protein [Thermoplasmata archaeon]